MARIGKDPFGNPPFAEWAEANPDVRLGTFEEAAKHGEMIINAAKGDHTLEAPKLAKEGNLNGKVLIDILNPLDFSRGAPISLTVSNTDSLGEQVQRMLPRANVVKTLNTINAYRQVDPRQLAAGDHHVFVSGNDPEATAMVAGFLRDWYGWKNVIDRGDITTSRGAEMRLPVWTMLLSALKTPFFNFKIVT
jgi:hypothetical protein